jgi:hypothetical protein
MKTFLLCAAGATLLAGFLFVKHGTEMVARDALRMPQPDMWFLHEEDNLSQLEVVEVLTAA